MCWNRQWRNNQEWLIFLSQWNQRPSSHHKIFSPRDAVAAVGVNRDHMRQNNYAERQRVWLHTKTCPQMTKKPGSVLEKAWLVCHVVVLQHFPPLPLELLYSLFLLLGTFCVPLFQQPGQNNNNKKERQTQWAWIGNSRNLVEHHFHLSHRQTGKRWLFPLSG